MIIFFERPKKFLHSMHPVLQDMSNRLEERESERVHIAIGPRKEGAARMHNSYQVVQEREREGKKDLLIGSCTRAGCLSFLGTRFRVCL